MLVKHNKFNIKMFYAFNEGGGDGSGGASVDPVQVPAAPTNDFLSFVPEQFHNESYVQDLLRAEDPRQELWTKFSGMQAALQTQPAGMPSIDAAPEDWKKWTETVAPKDIGVYGDLKPILSEDKAYLKDLLDPVYTSEVTTTILDAARQLGVQPFQMKGLVETFNNMQLQAADNFYASQQQAKQELDSQFDSFCEKQFGKDREKIVGEGFNFIAQHVSQDLVQHVNGLPNEALATVAALAYNLKQKYGVEDKLPNADSIYTGSGGDIVSLKAAIGEKMNSDSYRNAFDSRHNQTVAEVKQLSAQLARLTQPRKGY